MRILELSFHHAREFERVMLDAATPHLDVVEVAQAMQELEFAHDPREYVSKVPERGGLLEFVIEGSSSGHRYGIVFVDLGPAADAIAYWRTPPLYVDSGSAQPHGLSREHALLLATRRLEALT